MNTSLKSLRYLPLLFGMIIITMATCDDFFEADISKKSVTLLVPADGIETEIASQVFTWEALEGASSYRLMIVTPDFASAESMVLDTTVSATRFSMTFVPGSYEWRVRAQNSAYMTDWSYAGFLIYSSDDLTRQTVLLASPSDNYFTNKTKIRFEWHTLYNAESYEVRAYEDEWGGALLTEPVITAEAFAELPVTEHDIWWGVKAVNDASESQFTKRRIVVDYTSPVKPTLLAPSNNLAMSGKSVTFSWTSSDVIRSEATTDSLFISFESNMSEIVKVEAVTNESFTTDLTAGKTYYWCVNSTDKAGNTGPNSSVYQFSIK